VTFVFCGRHFAPTVSHVGFHDVVRFVPAIVSRHGTLMFVVMSFVFHVHVRPPFYVNR
jgi:hypothetical protein